VWPIHLGNPIFMNLDFEICANDDIFFDESPCGDMEIRQIGGYWLNDYSPWL